MTRASPWCAGAVAIAAAASPRVAAASHCHNCGVETPADAAEDALVVAADQAPVLEASAGFEVGTFHTAQVYNIGVGFGLEGGVRFDRLALLGQYSLLWLTDPNAGDTLTTTSYGDGATPGLAGASSSGPQGTPSGFVHRFGAVARYSVARGLATSVGLGLRGDLWVEAGGGEQLIRWDDGGYVNRPDVELGLGVQVQGRGKHRHGGTYMAVRATLAAPPPGSPALTAPPTCAGPCDGPSRPIGVDRSILFVWAFDFGG